MVKLVGVLEVVTPSLVLLGSFWQITVVNYDSIKDLDLQKSEIPNFYPFRAPKKLQGSDKLRKVKWEILGWIFIWFASVSGFWYGEIDSPYASVNVLVLKMTCVVGAVIAGYFHWQNRKASPANPFGTKPTMKAQNNQVKWHLPSAKPYTQLKIIHAELERQRDVNDKRFSNMFLRASILIAASGVQSGIDFSRTTSHWQILSGCLYLSAAACGFWVLRPLKGQDVVLNRVQINKLLAAPPYSVEHRIVLDNAVALEGDMKRLDGTGVILRIGYSLLVVSWVVFALVTHFAK